MKQISLEEVKEWQESNKIFELIDVRESWEHESYNIGGKLIPFGELMSRRTEIVVKDCPVVMYCRKGIRSHMAIQRLAPLYPNVDFYNLHQGIHVLESL